MLSPINLASPMTRLTVKLRAEVLSTKQNRDGPVKDSSTSKCIEKNRTFDFYYVFSPILIASKSLRNHVSQFNFLIYSTSQFLFPLRVFSPNH